MRRIQASLLGLVLGAWVGVQPSQAQGRQGFYCDNASGVPISMYINSQGGAEPWIRWVSDFFSDAGWTPQRRCQEVSARLETYRQSRQLKYITAGTMNGQKVICTASVVNGRCENLIFTLKRDVNVISTLNKLLAWREGQAGVVSLNESSAIPYIDVGSRLEADNLGGTPSVTPPANVQPNRPPQSPSPGRRNDFE